MNISKACIHLLEQLATLVKQIDQKDFSKPSEVLSKSTIGQHLRHTLEFFICLEQGFNQGVINYDKRAHNRAMEQDKTIVLTTIREIIAFVDRINSATHLKLEVGYDISTDEFVTIDTNAMRELIYNIEHAVHHMAIIKIGIREIAPYIKLPSDFGVAASTIRHQKESMESSALH